MGTENIHCTILQMCNLVYIIYQRYPGKVGGVTIGKEHRAQYSERRYVQRHVNT